MQDAKTIAEVSKKMIRNQFDSSLNEVLKNLHIQTKSKKVQKLIQKTSKKLAEKVIKNLRKQTKTEKKTVRKAGKKPSAKTDR